jgi:hypothetical protein
MPTLDDVINYVLTTEELSDLPTIADALNERFASEIGLAIEEAAEVEEAPAEEGAPAKEETPANLPPLGL